LELDTVSAAGVAGEVAETCAVVVSSSRTELVAMSTRYRLPLRSITNCEADPGKNVTPRSLALMAGWEGAAAAAGEETCAMAIVIAAGIKPTDNRSFANELLTNMTFTFLL
jgi:hypothetical protein